MSTASATQTLNPFDPVWRADPYPLYERLRELGDVVRVNEGFWVVARNSSVNAVLRDHTRFSSQSRAVRRGLVVGPMAQAMGESVQLTDPPAHTPVRSVLAGPFKPRRIADSAQTVQQVVDDLVGELLAADSADFATMFAYELPLRVITEILGVPSADRQLFRPWSVHFALAHGRKPAADVLARADQSMQECLGYLDGLAESRSAQPQDDLLSALLAQGEEDGSALTRRQVLVNAMLMLIAGHETTANLILNGMDAFFSHPEQWRKMVEDPELVSGAIEEALRYDSPVQFLTRIVTQDSDYGGHRLRSNESVVVALGAANRDPASYDSPDSFDITRPGAPNLAFGAGRHYCLGAPLALIEAKSAFRTLAIRLPRIRPDGDPVRLASETVRGFESYPVRL
jgi:cytochrome P450